MSGTALVGAVVFGRGSGANFVTGGSGAKGGMGGGGGPASGFPLASPGKPGDPGANGSKGKRVLPTPKTFRPARAQTCRRPCDSIAPQGEERKDLLDNLGCGRRDQALSLVRELWTAPAWAYSQCRNRDNQRPTLHGSVRHSSPSLSGIRPDRLRLTPGLSPSPSQGSPDERTLRAGCR